MGYQTYIPDEWHKMHEREQKTAAKAEAIKHQRTASWKKTIYIIGKTIGWIALSLVALLVVTAGLLAITGTRRR